MPYMDPMERGRTIWRVFSFWRRRDGCSTERQVRKFRMNGLGECGIHELPDMHRGIAGSSAAY